MSNFSTAVNGGLRTKIRVIVGFMSAIALTANVKSAYARPQDPSHRVPLFKADKEKVMVNKEPAGLVVYMNDKKNVILIDKGEEYKKGFYVRYDPKLT